MSLSPRATRAQRATGFAKKPAVAKTDRLNDRARNLLEARPAPRAIPVKLAPLLSPYKRHGRLSIRIERLPQLARLSAGRNNGDNSWSLTLDQLEDLKYLLPEGMDEGHSLAVRIIGLDGGGSTLAVLDFPVSPGVAVPETDDEAVPAAQDDTAEAIDNTQLRPLRAELAKLQASLVARESDLANAQQRYTQAEAEKQKIVSELIQGQAAWETEQDERKFLSLSAGLLMRKGEAGPSKLTLAGDEIELRCLREELAAMQASLAVRETALAQAGLAAEQAREHWRLESQAALSKAETAWRADEAARRGAAEAQWQERAARAAEARAQAEAARDSAHEVELRRLREELEALQASLADRKAALAQASSALEQTRERGQLDLETARAKAETAWRADEAARRGAAEAQWQERSARALAEMRAQSEAAHSKAEKAWKGSEIARLAAAEVQWQERSARALAEARIQSEAALSKAERTWKADEAARLAAAEVQWQEKSAKALAEARIQSEAALKQARISTEMARDSGDAIELRRLREELAVMQGSLSTRQTALAQAHLDLEQARERWQLESEAALSRAEKTWKANEAVRFAAAEAQWQEKSAKIVAEATERFGEAALKQLRSKAGASREQDNEIALQRLREELAATQAALAEQESALVQTGLGLEQSRERWQQESEEALSKARRVWKADDAARLAAAEAQWQETSARTLAEATKRFETAETALKQLLIRTEQTRESGNAIEHRRLREELAMMQTSLSDRESALAEARLALEQSREPPAPETKIVLKPDRMWNAVERREREDDRPKSFLIRDMIVVGALVASAIVFYPRFESYLPEIGTIFGNASAPASVPQRVAPRAAGQHMAVVNHGANVRAGPSSTAEIVSALQRGQQVATFEKRGSWTHIRMGGEPGKTEPREGWIFSSFLDDPAGGNAASPTAEGN
jgi:hypothetical protein